MKTKAGKRLLQLVLLAAICACWFVGGYLWRGFADRQADKEKYRLDMERRFRGAERLSSPRVPVTLVKVIDGDTIDITLDGKQDSLFALWRIRMLRINTPERGKPGYREATEALRAFLQGKKIFLEYETPGKPERGGFGRLLAYVRTENLNVNIEMVRLGWSKHYTKYGTGKYKAEFEAAEKEAKAAKRGLWAM